MLEEKKHGHWTVINLAALAEPNDPLGRSEGEALWPEKFSIKHLRAKRLEMGALAFGCLYQGKPSETEGLIFKRERWQSSSQPPQLKRVIISLDSAFKTGAENDFSAMQVWGEAETGFYLLHAWKQRVDYPTLKRTLISFYEQWRPSEVLIEDAASGQSLLQDLRHSSSLPLKAIKVDRDKETRAQACTGMLEAGRVFVPIAAPWLDAFLDELGAFPTAPHDDQVDACTMALNFLRGADSWIFHLPELYPECFPKTEPITTEEHANQQLDQATLNGWGERLVASVKQKITATPTASCPQCGRPVGRCGLAGVEALIEEKCGACGWRQVLTPTLVKEVSR